MSIEYCDIEGGSTFGAWATGDGNIDSDPLFNNPISDLRLQIISPCIDSGHPSTSYNDTDGTQNDMGAYGGPNGDW